MPTHPFLWIYAGALGLVIGSYLNVLIHRLPRGLSTVLPPSSCPSCGTRIRLYDNIPLFSYLALGGRCRACRAQIPWRYPLVELATALLFVACLGRFGAGWDAVAAAAFCALLVALALIDLEHFLLPDALTLPGIAIGLLLQPLISWCTWIEAFVGAAIGALVPLAIIALWRLLRGVQALGYGDVKMLAMVGAFLGWKGVLMTIFFGALLGTLVGMPMVLRGRLGMQSRLPFGFFLAIGALLSLFWGEGILRWYFGFYP